MADIVFSTARVPTCLSQNHSAIIQDIIPDTLHSTDCAAVVEKDFLLLHLPWRPTLLCWVHHALWVSLRKCWHDTQPIRSGQVSQHLLCWVHCLLSSYLCLLNIYPKECRNMVAPVKVLCQLPHGPVQDEGDEITPSCANNEINGAKRAPFCTKQTSKSLGSN